MNYKQTTLENCPVGSLIKITDDNASPYGTYVVVENNNNNVVVEKRNEKIILPNNTQVLLDCNLYNHWSYGKDLKVGMCVYVPHTPKYKLWEVTKVCNEFATLIQDDLVYLVYPTDIVGLLNLTWEDVANAKSMDTMDLSIILEQYLKHQQKLT